MSLWARWTDVRATGIAVDHNLLPCICSSWPYCSLTVIALKPPLPLRAIDTTSPIPAITTPVSVRADAGATLEAASDLPVNRLVYDASAGAGVLKGLAFADSGMIDIVNAESTILTRMTYDLSESDNLTNLSSWTVRDNGRLKPGWRVKATASGLVLQRPGLIILVK